MSQHTWLSTAKELSAGWIEAERQKKLEAQVETITPEELLELAKGTSSSGRHFAATHKKTTAEARRILANDKEPYISRHAAQFTDDIELIKEFAKYPLSYPREGVLLNKKVPPDLLNSFANDPDEKIRGMVANLTKSSKVLKKLSKDPSETIQRSVAGNKNTPPDVLEVLSKSTGYKIKEDIARNENTPPDVLKTFAKDPEMWVRFHVAGHPSVPRAAATQLAKDSDKYIREHLAKNPSVPNSILELLQKDKSVAVARKAFTTWRKVNDAKKKAKNKKRKSAQ